MKHALAAVALGAIASFALAKLPPPDDAAKAKAAETAAKAAWQAKVEAYQLCKAQDRIAALYRKNGGKAPMPAAATKPASGAATAAPAASAPPPPPCIEPGPYASNPPEQKPLETSEAHSPTGTAASPPSVKEHSGAIQAPKKP